MSPLSWKIQSEGLAQQKAEECIPFYVTIPMQPLETRNWNQKNWKVQRIFLIRPEKLQMRA